MKLYFIFDRKSEKVTLFLSDSDSDAMRAFIASVADVRSMLHQYPEDFELYSFPVLNFGDNYEEALDLSDVAKEVIGKCPRIMTGDEAYNVALSIKRRSERAIMDDSTEQDAPEAGKGSPAKLIPATEGE